tara:strand:- start:311 stop:733 length:423 start_codon:yes stop_codon:yes gene_type:complete
MSEHKWAKYQMNKEREYYNPRFGGNLKEFIRRMVEDEGYTIGNFFPLYDGRDYRIMEVKQINENDFEEIAYQALNYEHTNLDFEKEIDGKDVGQTVSITMTGDAWCDVIPVNDWSFKRGSVDVVGRVTKSMREEIMGDEA